MSKYQKLQLDDISYEYERFKENQLLTHDQLNRFIDFFEDQDRITRTCLIGVGLVCGLTAKWSKGVLYINKGCAVTTDGDLMVIEKNTGFRYFKKYDNRRKGTDEPIYDPFFPPASKGTQIPLWEMRTVKDDDTGVPAIDIAKFTDTSGYLITDMVALLYIENYLSDPDDCTSIDCNHLGQLQSNKIKVLLAHPDDIDAIINKETKEIIADDIYKSYYDAYTAYFSLPELKSKRLLFTNDNTASLSKLNEDYQAIVKSSINELSGAIAKLYSTFKFILDETSFFKIEAIQKEIKKHAEAGLQPYQVQYLYDFYKDLLDSYNELKDTVYNAVYICCPNKYAFPKHIMLGIVNGALGPRPPKYRHYFYSSPITSRGKSYLSVARSMFNRLNNMIFGFSIPQRNAAIRITPSVTPDKTIEWRAIPFYYNNAKMLAENWSYYRTMRGTNNNILSYHFADNGVSSFVTTPLDFDIDKNNFFRIEGHQGRQLDEALRSIIQQKNDKNLPFDVVAVRLSENQSADIDFEDFAFYFEDLNVVLNAWIVSQNCLFAKAIKFFSAFNVNGKHQSVRYEKAESTFTASNAEPPKTKVEEASIKKTNKVEINQNVNFNQYQYAALSNYQYFQYNKNENFLKENLIKDAGTLGSMMIEIEYNKVIRPSDYVIIEIQKKIKENELIKQLPEDVIEVAFTIPALIIARLTDVLNYEPFGLDDLTGDALQNYRDALEQLCKDVNESIEKVTAYFAKIQKERDVNVTGSEIAVQYLNTLQALKDNCCAADSIEVLASEIENRKQKIADMLTFSNYANKHKGLEHRAGVERGGTFVMLYASAEVANVDTRPAVSNDKTLDLIYRYEREFLIKGKKEIDIKEFYKQEEDYYLVALAYNAKKFNVVKEIENYVFENNNKTGNAKLIQSQTKKLVDKINLIAGRIATQPKGNTVNNIVVADFCLPYLSSSEIPPMTFVVPPVPVEPEPPVEPEVSLSLPVKEVCANDSGVYIFTKEPQDGVVKALQKEASNAIVNKEGKTYFNPRTVEPAIYGKQINFTINDKETDCVIVVHAQPVPEFSYEINNDGTTVILYLYNNTKDDKEHNSYEWEIYNGTEIRKAAFEKDPTEVVFKTAELKEPFVRVRLIANSTYCSNYTEKVVVWKEEDEKVSLDLGRVLACLNESAFAIKRIEPKDALLHCTNAPDIIVRKEDTYIINPAKTPAGAIGVPLSFTVNGKDVPETLTVSAPPDAKFTIDEKSIQRVENHLSFDILLSNAGNNFYDIEINGIEYKGEAKPDEKGIIRIIRFDISKLGTDIKVVLTAKPVNNSPCLSESFSQEFSIPKQQELPKEEPPQNDTPKEEEKKCTGVVKTNLEISVLNMQKLISGTRDKTLSTLLRNLTNLYSSVNSDIVLNGKITKVDEFLNSITTIHTNLLQYNINFSVATAKTDAGILMILRMYALQLALDIVRCDTKFSASRMGVIGSILNLHNEVLPSAKNTYGLTTEMVEEYIKIGSVFKDTFIAQDKAIIQLINKLLSIVK